MELKYKIRDGAQPILLKIGKGEWIVAEKEYDSKAAADAVILAATEKLKPGTDTPIEILKQDRLNLKLEGERYFFRYGTAKSVVLIDAAGNYKSHMTSFIDYASAQGAIDSAVELELNGVNMREDMNYSHRSHLRIETKYTFDL